MIRLVLLSLACLVAVAVGVLGWRGQTSRLPPRQPWSDMTDQPKYRPQAASGLFADGRAQRPPVEGTVPWGRDARGPDAGFARADADFYDVARIPVPLDRALLERGREVYGIYCALCHGLAGEGDGITTKLGMNPPPSYHDERLRAMPAGEIFRTITEGKNTMGPYGDRIGRDDRWAVVAWVRTLQRAFDARIDEVPADVREGLER